MRNGPTIVVTAIDLKPAARHALAERLGPGHVVVDIRDAQDTADIVLIPPASPQLVGSLRGMFPQARLLITEFTDAEYGAHFAGPVARSIDSGADGYFVAPTIDDLAIATQQAAVGRVAGVLTSGPGDEQRSAAGQLTRSDDLDRTASRGDSRAIVVRIDLGAWAEQSGLDSDTLRRLAAPLLAQLRRQGFDIETAGPQ